MDRSNSMVFLSVLLVLLFLAGCGGAATAPSSQNDTHSAMQDSHEEDGDAAHADEHDDMAAMSHGVPEEAAAVANPVETNAASIAAGAQVYATSCAVCHGESGQGDGPGAAALEPKPAHLDADHVQENSDGALFYIISEGRPGTAMPAWAEVLSEQQRWEVVNYIRTFGK